MIWHTTRRVEFQHCDPAGIVFYPRYLEMVNSVIEEYFRDHIGYAFGSMHFSDRRGVPTVKIPVEFQAPGFLEDLLDFAVEIVRLGKSSLEFLITCTCNGEARMTASPSHGQTDINTGTSTPWPAMMREKLQA